MGRADAADGGADGLIAAIGEDMAELVREATFGDRLRFPRQGIVARGSRTSAANATVDAGRAPPYPEVPPFKRAGGNG